MFHADSKGSFLFKSALFLILGVWQSKNNELNIFLSALLSFFIIYYINFKNEQQTVAIKQLLNLDIFDLISHLYRLYLDSACTRDDPFVPPQNIYLYSHSIVT